MRHVKEWQALEKKALLGDKSSTLQLVSALRGYRQAVESFFEEHCTERMIDPSDTLYLSPRTAAMEQLDLDIEAIAVDTLLDEGERWEDE